MKHCTLPRNRKSIRESSSTFIKLVNMIDTKQIQDKIDKLGIDEHIRKLDVLTLIRLFFYAQLFNIPSLKQLSEHVESKPHLSKCLGFNSISVAHLSRKIADLDCQILLDIFNICTAKLVSLFKREGKKVTNIIDASVISLCLSQYNWAKYKETKSGIKIHTRLILVDKACCIEKVNLTYANQADNKQMDSLILLDPGALHVFDRGYIDHEKFDTYCENGIRFVTRLKRNIVVRVIREIKRPEQEGDPITREAIVMLGSQKKKMKHPLRLIELKDTKGNSITVITNDFEITAEEVSVIYRNRWKIETFFRWIKQNLAITNLYGTTQNAVYNQVMISLILFNLLVLLHPKAEMEYTLGVLLRKIRLFWDQSFDVLRSAYNREIRKSLKEKGRELELT